VGLDVEIVVEIQRVYGLGAEFETSSRVDELSLSHAQVRLVSRATA